MAQVPATRPMHYRISPRVQRAIELLVTGEAPTITAAAAAVGMVREALSKALNKPHVATYMQERIQRSLKVSAVKAVARLDALLTSENAMVSLRSAQFCLGAGMGVT